MNSWWPSATAQLIIFNSILCYGQFAHLFKMFLFRNTHLLTVLLSFSSCTVITRKNSLYQNVNSISSLVPITTIQHLFNKSGRRFSLKVIATFFFLICLWICFIIIKKNAKYEKTINLFIKLIIFFATVILLCFSLYGIASFTGQWTRETGGYWNGEVWQRICPQWAVLSPQ